MLEPAVGAAGSGLEKVKRSPVSETTGPSKGSKLNDVPVIAGGSEGIVAGGALLNVTCTRVTRVGSTWMFWTFTRVGSGSAGISAVTTFPTLMEKVSRGEMLNAVRRPMGAPAPKLAKESAPATPPIGTVTSMLAPTR